MNLTKSAIRKMRRAVQALALIFPLTAAACSASVKPPLNSETPTYLQDYDAAFWDKVQKPEKISVFTAYTNAHTGVWEPFFQELSQKTGITVTQAAIPDGGSLAFVLNQVYRQENIPDVILLPEFYYAKLAAEGKLWDMTDAWKISKTRNSGRLTAWGESVIRSLFVTGSDGNEALYGFAPYGGGGYATCIRTDWLEKAGYQKNNIADQTFSFENYYQVLKHLKAANLPEKTGVLSLSVHGGILDSLQKLPEFMQNAETGFYYNKISGKYEDGFSQAAMRSALIRLQTAWNDGILCQPSQSEKEDFLSGKTGVCASYVGNSHAILSGSSQNADVVYINPVSELGSYVRSSGDCYIWAISATAKNPEGIFSYLIDTMLDGKELQTLWTYGVENTCWSLQEELNESSAGKSDTPNVKLHLSQNQNSSPSELRHSYEAIDPLRTIAGYDPDYKLGTATGDPGASLLQPSVRERFQWFLAVSKSKPIPPYIEDPNISLIYSVKEELLKKVITQNMDIDEAIAEYQQRCGAFVETILARQNNSGG